jgi:predicted nucleic acid-binding protein
MKIFVDNDVILDVLLERKGFEHSKTLLNYIENKHVTAYTSPIIFTNSFYIISKSKGKKSAWTGLKKLRLLFKVSKVTEKIVDLALASDFTDFEDAIQHYTSLEQKANYLITRNKRDYINPQIPILTPQEYIAMISLS